MRAAVFREHGGPEVIEVVDDWPEPGAERGTVVVEVGVCALNHLDVFVRRGMPGVSVELPHVSGGDIAGVVRAVGHDVVGVQPGDRVLLDPAVHLPDGHVGALGENTQGGLCERIAVPVGNTLLLPDSVSLEAAAALPIAYGTAHRMLFTRGSLQAGETIVVLGASGGVGTACVQLAKLADANVIAVAGTEEKLRRLEPLGADHLVLARGSEYGKEVWRVTGKQGADVIVDYTGAATWPTTLRTLRKGGRALVCGATTGYEAETDLRYVWVREETIIGSDGWERADLEALVLHVEAGRIQPVIDRIVPLEGVADAERAIEAREVFGKVLVKP
jgi:alcohol dehydrogenase